MFDLFNHDLLRSNADAHTADLRATMRASRRVHWRLGPRRSANEVAAEERRRSTTHPTAAGPRA